MGGKKFGGRRELDTNVTADLSYPDLFALEAQRYQPQTQVIALVNRAAGFLEGDVLRAPKRIQRADRGIDGE